MDTYELLYGLNAFVPHGPYVVFLFRLTNLYIRLIYSSEWGFDERIGTGHCCMNSPQRSFRGCYFALNTILVPGKHNLTEKRFFWAPKRKAVFQGTQKRSGIWSESPKLLRPEKKSGIFGHPKEPLFCQIARTPQYQGLSWEGFT